MFLLAGATAVALGPGYAPVTYASDDPAVTCGCLEGLQYSGQPNHCGWGVALPCGDLVSPTQPLYEPLDASVCELCYPPGWNLWERRGCVVGTPPYGGGGPRSLSCYGHYCAGRAPAGLDRAARATGTPLGSWLADTAHLEAASVNAFARMQRELVLHDAPGSLVKRAARAERDEVRHARTMTKLARRFGADEGDWSAPVRCADVPDRTLEAIALENAVEGCVNETYAALLAMWQAEHAREPAVRAAMKVIAEDETRHAALSWSVAEWLLPKLESASRQRVGRAIRDALDALVFESQRAARPELVAAGILPDLASSRALAASLVDALSRAPETSATFTVARAA